MLNMFVVLDLWIDSRTADLDRLTQAHPEMQAYHDARRRELLNMREFLEQLRKP